MILNNTLKREIHVYGVEGLVQVEIDHTGLRFHIKGSRKFVETTWNDVVKTCITGTDVPSFLHGCALALLIHEADKVNLRKAKNEIALAKARTKSSLG